MLPSAPKTKEGGGGGEAQSAVQQLVVASDVLSAQGSSDIYSVPQSLHNTKKNTLWYQGFKTKEKKKVRDRSDS